MHRAVLADLELGEVKSKSLGLPDEMLQLSIRKARRSGRGKRIANRAQVIEQLPWRHIRQITSVGSRRPQTVGDMKQELTVRIRRTAARKVVEASRIRSTRRRDPPLEGG
jgi:hypothetical protein